MFYERALKVLVALIVLCFMGVVVRLSMVEEGLDWGGVVAGFVPDFGAITRPAAGYEPMLAALGDGAREWWTNRLVGMQRDVMIAAAATAVGINMTFLMPYSLLSRGWTREFRGLVRFDLATGMLIPFLVATSCVVLAAASQFHTKEVPGLVDPIVEGQAEPAAGLRKDFDGQLLARAKAVAAADELAWDELDGADREARIASIPVEERRIAAMLVKRDAFDLAGALRPLTGDFFANVIFGLGVIGMALSTITLLMLISGFVICEMLGLPPTGWPHRLGSLAACTGVLGPFLWGDAKVYLAVPTSVFGMVLLPIAYWTFFLMMNSRSLLGEDRPRGGARVAWNALMLPAAGVATVASLWSVWAKTQWNGIAAVGVFLALALVAHVRRR